MATSIRSRARRRSVHAAAQCVAESLEPRMLLSAIHWTGSGGNSLWSNPANWNTGMVPGVADDVTINMGGNPTITYDSTAGTVPIGSLTSSDPMVISGGSLTITGAGAVKASQITGGLTVTGGSLDVTGSGTSLSANGTAAIANASLKVDAGATLAFTQAAGLTADNLTAAGGSQLLFPAATSYTGSSVEDTTIAATGSSSLISLTDLATFDGGGYDGDSFATSVLPTSGGEVDLAGAIGTNGANANYNRFTLDNTGGILGVAGITSLSGSYVTDTGGPSMSFTMAKSLTAVNLSAGGGSQLLFPAATSYTGSSVEDTTIAATGSSSLISLTDLATFDGGGYDGDSFATSVLPTSGGEVDLTGAIGTNGANANYNRFTLDNTGGILGVAGITSLSGSYVTDTGGPSMSFTMAKSLTAVNLSAGGGSQLLFPAATSYTGSSVEDTTIAATGSSSLISLTDLATFDGGGYDGDSFATSVLPTSGGEVDLAGAIGTNGANANYNRFTLDNTGGILGVAGITSLSGSYVTDTGGPSMSFTMAKSLTAVNLSAGGGSQLLFPAATSYTGSSVEDTTIAATGSSSLISLTDLATFDGGGYDGDSFATSVLPTSGGEVDLAGAIGTNGANANYNRFTLDNTGGILGVAGITSLSGSYVTDTGGPSMSFTMAKSLTAVNLSAGGGSQLLFPAATSYTGSSVEDTTIAATGSSSLISLTDLATFDGGGYDGDSFATSVLPTSGGEVDLAGAIGTNGGSANNFTLDGGALTINGNYTLSSNDTINIGIDSTGAGQLNIVGGATLNGTLDISVLNGFVPTMGVSYNVVTYGSATGAFSTVNGLLETGVGFTTSMSATGITLLTTQGLGSTPATATLSSTNPTVAPGSAVTFMTTFAAPSSSAPTPTGTVTFLDSSTQLGMSTLSATGSATLTTSALSNGAHTITVSYSGDANYAPGVSSPIIETVAAAVPAASIGNLDPTFGVNGLVSHAVNLTSTAGLVVEADPGSIIAGTAGTAGNQVIAITRYNTDGSLDTTFGTGGVTDTPIPGDAQAAAEALLADGDILVAGTVTSLVNGQSAGSQFALVEYTSAGLLDTTFGNGAGYVLTSFSSTAGALSNDAAHALTVGPDGTVYVGGSSDADGHGLDFAIAAYTPSGGPSPAFGTNGRTLLDFMGGDDSIGALALGLKGQLIAAGSAIDPSSGVSAVALAEFAPNGALNPKFGVKGKLTTSVGGVDDAASGLGIEPKGEIVVGGYTGIGSASASTLSANFLVLRYDSMGKLDKTFGRGGIVTTSFSQPAAISSVLIDADGTIVASGKTVASLAMLNVSELNLAVARYTAKGQLDPSFNMTGTAIYTITNAVTTASLTTSAGANDRSALLQSTSSIPFDTTSDLMAAFMQLTGSDQGVIAATTGGELLDVGNSDGNTVEAAIVAQGLDLAATLTASLPQSVIGGGKGTASVNVAEVGTQLAEGTFAVELFASSTSSPAAGQTAFQTFSEKLKLKEGMAKSLSLKFEYPSSLSDGSYYLIATVTTGTTRDLNPANNTSHSNSPLVIAQPFVQLAGSLLSTPTFDGAKPVLVSFTVTNVGNETASGTPEVQFFASTSGTPTGAISLATPPIRLIIKPSVGRVFKVKFALPTTVPAGTYSLVALLDPANIFKDPNAATNFIVSRNAFVVA